MALSHNQDELVTQKKTYAGWLDGSTPSSVFTLNDKVRAMIINSLVSTTQENVRNTNFTSTYGLVPFSIRLPESHGL